MKPLLVFLIALFCLYSLRHVISRWAMRQMAKRVQRQFTDMQNEVNKMNSRQGNETTASPADKKIDKNVGDYVEFEEINNATNEG